MCSSAGLGSELRDTVAKGAAQHPAFSSHHHQVGAPSRARPIVFTSMFEERYIYVISHSEARA